MVTIFVVLTLLFLLKLGVDFISAQGGYITLVPIEGFMLGILRIRDIKRYKEQDGEKTYDLLETRIQLSIGFVAIIFLYNQPTEAEDDEQNGDE